LLREKGDDITLQVDLTMDPAQPTHVSNNLLQGAETPPEFMPQRETLTQLTGELQQRAQSLTAQGRLAGNILVVHNGKTVFFQSYGLADRASGKPVQRATRFRIASMYKMFTAVAVLQLVEAGKVSLDSPLSNYLADYPNHELANSVTVRQLLDHTGGTGDIFNEAFFKHRDQFREISDYLAAYGTRAAEFTPGSEDRYSNYGFVLLGAVIEKASGESYDQYLEQHVFAPAHMTSTGRLPEDLMGSQLAVGYTRQQDGSYAANQDALPYRGTPAGGGYSTVDDLLSFTQALDSGALLSAPMLAEATRPQNHKAWYGLGFATGGNTRERWLGHDGGAPGMNGELRVYPELHTVVIGLANSDPTSMEQLTRYFADRIPETP
jgi:D-alanyl-D-alanine carboxypeptidase